MDLFDRVKKETWLFLDDEIYEIIRQMRVNSNLNDAQKNDEEYVMLYCYKNKGKLSKEEYDKEVKEYLYKNVKETEEQVNQVIKDNQKWFDSYYDEAVEGNNTYFHAVQYARENMMHLFCRK